MAHSIVRPLQRHLPPADRHVGQQLLRLGKVAARLIEGALLWFENLGKRQVKSPKVYLRDSGILHSLQTMTHEVRIDPAILSKEGLLTEEEREQIRLHPEYGVEHLARFELPWDVEAIVRGHHERFDGTGYPDGLAGEEIPLGARIVLAAAEGTEGLEEGRLAAAESAYYAAARRAPRDPTIRAALGRYLAARGGVRAGAVLLEEAQFFGGDSAALARVLVPLYLRLRDFRALYDLKPNVLSGAERRRALLLTYR